MIFGYRRQHHSPWDSAPAWAIDLREMLNTVLTRENIMSLDQTKLIAAVARLQASDTAAVAALTAMRDQNKTVAAQLAAVSKQLADLQAEDTAEIQTQLDGLADKLNATADDVESAVAANPDVPDMPDPPAVDPDAPHVDLRHIP